MAFPSDLVFYASLDSSFTAEHSDSGTVIPHTINGTATIQTVEKNCGIGAAKFTHANGVWQVTYGSQTSIGQKGSVSFWLYPDSSSTQDIDPFLINMHPSGNSVMSLSGSKTSLVYTMFNGSGGFVFGSFGDTITPDAWNHIEASWDFDAGNAELFVDGISVYNPSFASATMNTGLMEFIYVFDLEPTGLIYIDNVAIYNAVQHTSNFTPACLSFGPSNVPFNTFGYPFGFPSKRGLGR